jgi:glutaredoxin-like protein NrdH
MPEKKKGKKKEIVLYTISTCGFCRAMKNYLSEKGVEYDYTDVDLVEGEERERVLKAARKLNPYGTFPTAVINGKVIVGFDEEAIKEALGK